MCMRVNLVLRIRKIPARASIACEMARDSSVALPQSDGFELVACENSLSRERKR